MQRESTVALTQQRRLQGLEKCPCGILNFVYRSQTKSSVPYRISTHRKDDQALLLPFEGERVTGQQGGHASGLHSKVWKYKFFWPPVIISSCTVIREHT